MRGDLDTKVLLIRGWFDLDASYPFYPRPSHEGPAINRWHGLESKVPNSDLIDVECSPRIKPTPTGALLEYRQHIRSTRFGGEMGCHVSNATGLFYPYDAVLLERSCNRLINIKLKSTRCQSYGQPHGDPTRIPIGRGKLLLDILLTDRWINCSAHFTNQISSISAFILRGWMSRVVLR